MNMEDLKERVTNILRTDVATALSLDGSGIEVVDVTDNIVRLRLDGVCAGCPATLMTLITSLEQELRARIPEIEYLEPVP